MVNALQSWGAGAVDGTIAMADMVTPGSLPRIGNPNTDSIYGASYTIGEWDGPANLIGAGGAFKGARLVQGLTSRITAANKFAAAGGKAASLADDILPTPQVSSAKLQNLVDNLYKGTTNPNRVGNGTTMGAIRNEIATGIPTGGRMHTVKGQETLNGLNKWLWRNGAADYYDRLVAQSLADELATVLGGVG